MSPRELVRRAIRFERPARLPVRCPSLGVSDTLTPPLAAGGAPPAGGLDEWGCRWSARAPEDAGRVLEPPAPDPDRLRVPEYRDLARYAPAVAALAQEPASGESERYVLVELPLLLFERLQALCGLERLLLDLGAGEKMLERLADRVVEAQLEFIAGAHRHLGARLDGFYATDDWGAQAGPLVAPELWQNFFAPRYRRLAEAVHVAGADLWLHTCGQTTELLPELVAAGVNVLALPQPRLVGIAEIGRALGGRVALESHADVQATLPRGHAAAVTAEVAGLLAHWARPAGGFILGEPPDAPAALGLAPSVARELYAAAYATASGASARLYGRALPGA